MEYNVAKVSCTALDKESAKGSLETISSRRLKILIIPLETEAFTVAVIPSYFELSLKKCKPLEGFSKGRVERELLCLKLQNYLKKDQLL